MEELYRQIGAGKAICQAMLIGTLIVMRVLPIIFQTPYLGGKLVPMETRMGLSIGLAVLVYPFARDTLSGTLDINPAVYIALMFQELFIGYVLGFVATELFYAME